MRQIDTIYIGGEFVTPHGETIAPLHNPATEEVIGQVRLGDEVDVDRAVSAAQKALPSFSRTTPAFRAMLLGRLSAAVTRHADALAAAMREEYGAPSSFVDFSARRAGSVFTDMAKVVEAYPFRRTLGHTEVEMLPSGVAAAITPWNSNFGFICSKLATAVAAGAPLIIKPSELSAIQTQVLSEALHEADLPSGVLNIVNGYGDIVGAALSRHPGVSKVSFTGSTAVGRTIFRAAADTLKRVTLELGGKSPSVIMEDADLDAVIPQVLGAGFINSGQACIAGARILAPVSRISEIHAKLVLEAKTFKAGLPEDARTRVGPMVSAKQWDRVQDYIRLGLEEGATLLTGGLGRPDGLDRGWFVKPTIFSDVRNDMRIAREEIFGPVLSVIPYRDEADAVAIANDTDYGLQAYVFGADLDRARALADQLLAGRVAINGAGHDPAAPFGGFKQSGVGRECQTALKIDPLSASKIDPSVGCPGLAARRVAIS